MSFDMRMRKFVQLKQTTNTSRGKKRRATYTGDVITIQSDLDLDPSTMFPDHNANDFAEANEALQNLVDHEFE